MDLQKTSEGSCGSSFSAEVEIQVKERGTGLHKTIREINLVCKGLIISCVSLPGLHWTEKLGEGNGVRGGRGVGLSQFFPEIYWSFYSRFLHHFPCTFDLLFSHYSVLYQNSNLINLQWTLIFRVKSRKAGAFKASNTDLVKLEDPLLTLDDPALIHTRLSFVHWVSYAVYMIQVPCRFQVSEHAQYALRTIFHYILPIILV